MLSEEEKDAIKLLKDIENDCWTTKYIMSSDSKNAKILLNLITKLQKENELAKEQLKKQCENNKKNYERFNIAINKALGINLKRKLQINKLSIAEWFSKKAKEYIERDE